MEIRNFTIRIEGTNFDNEREEYKQCDELIEKCLDGTGFRTTGWTSMLINHNPDLLEFRVEISKEKEGHRSIFNIQPDTLCNAISSILCEASSQRTDIGKE